MAAAAVTGWFDQMVVPTPGQVLDPPWRRTGRRRDHRTGQADGHGPLELKQTVEQPQEPEADPKEAPACRLGIGHRSGDTGRGSRRPPPSGTAEFGRGSRPGPPVRPGLPDEQLVVEGRSERRSDGRVVGLEGVPHAWHFATNLSGPPVTFRTGTQAIGHEWPDRDDCRTGPRSGLVKPSAPSHCPHRGGPERITRPATSDYPNRRLLRLGRTDIRLREPAEPTDTFDVSLLLDPDDRGTGPAGRPLSVTRPLPPTTLNSSLQSSSRPFRQPSDSCH